jgi:Methyltransferase domain
MLTGIHSLSNTESSTARTADPIPSLLGEAAVLLKSLVGENVILGMMDALRSVGAGCVVEVGVYKGGTAYFLDQWAQYKNRECYLYDTFCGMPYAEPGDSHALGDFADTSAMAVKELIPHAHVIPGIFPTSAIDMPRVAFAHIDVDQYRAYIESCSYLDPLMAPGSIMWFDDADCIPAAGKAVFEMYGDRVQKFACGHQIKFGVRF